MLKMNYLLFIYYQTNAILGKKWRQIDVLPRSAIPKVAHLLEGNSITVYCGSSTQVNWTFIKLYDPDPAFNYSHEPVSKRHSKKWKKIKLNRLLANDSGHYYCHGSYQDVNFEAIFCVQVYKEAQYGQVLPSWVEVPEYGVVTLTCKSVLPPKWSSKHYKYQKKIVKGDKITLSELRPKHSGRYGCQGTRPRIIRYFDEYESFHSSAVVIVDSEVRFVNTQGKLSELKLKDIAILREIHSKLLPSQFHLSQAFKTMCNGLHIITGFHFQRIIQV